MSKQLIPPLIISVFSAAAIALNVFAISEINDSTERILGENSRHSEPSVVDIGTVAYYGSTLEMFYPSADRDVVAGDCSVIGSGAFNGVRLKALGLDGMIDSVFIEEGVSAIEARAFYQTSAETIRLPSTLRYIGEGAFADSPSLKKIYFDEVPEYSVEIAPGAFSGSKNIEFVNFPEGTDFYANNADGGEG